MYRKDPVPKIVCFPPAFLSLLTKLLLVLIGILVEDSAGAFVAFYTGALVAGRGGMSLKVYYIAKFLHTPPEHFPPSPLKRARENKVVAAQLSSPW